MRIKSIVEKVSRIIGWIVFCVLTLLITVILLVRVPSIQNRIAQKAISYLQNKIKTKVDLKSIAIDFPKTIVVEGLYLEDQQKDTLIYVERIAIDAPMWGLLHHEVTLDDIEVNGTTGNISKDSVFNFDYIIKAFASADTIPDTTASTPWKISIGDIELASTKVTYDDKTSPMRVTVNVGKLEINTHEINLDSLSVDLNKINVENANISYFTDSTSYRIKDLQLSASDFKYDSTNMEADIKNISLEEKTRNIILSRLSGFARMRKAEIDLKAIELIAGQSQIYVTGSINYQSLAGNIELSKTKIAFSDILRFQPGLLDSLPVNIPKGTVLSIEAKISGDTTNARIDKLELHTFDSTYVSLNGNYNKSNLDLVLKKFSTSANDIKTVLSDTLLPATPNWLALQGNVKGSVTKPIITANLTTDLGTVSVDGGLDMTHTPKYKAKFVARSIEAGKLSGQSSLGSIDFDLNVDGSGFTTKDINTKVNLIVHDATYNNYTFQNLKVDGVIDKFLFSGKAAMSDENLDFELNASLDYNKDIPSYKAQLDLKNLDLKGLKVTERPMKMRMTIDTDLATSDFKVLNGSLNIRHVAVFNGEKLYAIDSMLFASLDQANHSKMSIRSDIISGDFEGSFNIFGIADVLQNHFNRYFSNGKKPAPEGPPQDFTFNVQIKNTDLLTEVLVPELEPFTPGIIRGEFDSREHILNLVFRMPKMKYNTIRVDSLVFLVKSDADELRYFSKVDNLVLDTIKINQVNLGGGIAHDSIRATLNVLDSIHKKKYRVGTHIARNDGLMRVHLDDSLLLNYSKWNVPNDNYLAVGDRMLAANHLEIIKQAQKVIISGDTRKDPALTVKFVALELNNFTQIFSDIIPASGELNGDFKFNTSGGGDFTSKLTISDLTVFQKTLGDLSFDVNHSKDRYNLLVGLRGNRTQVQVKGAYTDVLDLAVDMPQLNMEVVQAFSFGQLATADGLLTGSLRIKGKPSHPDIVGSITFANATITPTYLNSKFELKNETISIRNDNISLNNFTILDGPGSKATLNGNINIKTYTNPQFDLTLSTKDFQLMDTKEGSNDLFYGRVKINSTARISGSAQQPKATFKVNFGDDSDFTYIVPTSEKGVLEAKGIVKFVDKDSIGDAFIASLKATDSVQTEFSGMEVSAIIDLTDKAILNIVVDPITGDKLTVQGNSSLTFNMTASGNMDLSGRYEITKGSYNLSFYNLVKRQFSIEKGSTITWSGDPLNAQMDIRASNTVETSPLELVSNQVSANDPAANNFNQRLPFLVFLNIKGLLLAPQISFSLDMPADKRNAFGGILYSRLQDINSRESDLNKQVFGLLILRRFVADSPFDGSGGGATGVARTSVSRILSEQLNRLTSKVKGVQLSFDIKSYEDAKVQGGTQGTTKAQLGVSKSLFGDRLVVKLAGNVDIEGQDAGSNNVTDYIGDLALEYKMTADGRFRVTGFRNSNYDMIDGELIETGAGLIYIKDYNTLRELFKANEKP